MGVRSIEWPTVAVAGVIACGFAALLRWHEHLPLPVTLVALAVLGAWYNSLQHEVVHGHPTPWRWCNSALAIVPLGLVVPLRTYRAVHLAHHRTRRLTDPTSDPESFYVAASTWERAGRPRRALLIVLRTLAGRLLIGPVVAAVNWWWIGLAAMRSPAGRISIGGHLLAVAGVIAVVDAAGMPIWIYLVGVPWAGGALSMLRSFAEHRLPDDGTRSAVVRSNWFFSLVFLNNNLHHTHHAHPRAAWYTLPGVHARLGADDVAARGAGFYRGYAEITRRYLLRPLDHPAVPSTR